MIVAGPAPAVEWAAARIGTSAAGVVRVTTAASDASANPDELAACSVLVDVTGGSAEWASTTSDLARGRVVVRLPPPRPGGRIVLVGGGPGDASLQTVRAREELFAADVVFTDRLVTHDDHELIRAVAPAARIVDVGKLPGHHRVPQRDIEALMVREARAGGYVVRLKGGDPFVFGRGGEEVAAARAAGVPVEVVPGITSAVSVPEVAGIPVTQRAVSHAFTVISGHDPLTEAECAHLVGLGGTIVVLMGVATFVQSVSGLLAAGLDPATPFAVVERGYTPAQRVVRGVVLQAADLVTAHRVEAPAVIVIGAVADLPELR